MMHTFAEQVIAFNSHLHYTGILPPGIRIMNPFREQPQVMDIMRQFYRKYYGDHHQRRMIMGINPGRLGSGATGIPFTDTKRLTEVLDIGIEGVKTHEPSSVFVYDVISAYGGPTAFYKDFYFASVSPLGFTSVKADGSEVNYNYYDSKALTNAVYDFMVSSIREQLAFGIDTDVCYCFGTGKNAAFLQQLNAKEQFFKTIVPLEHPRFVMQYRLKRKEEYITKYLEAFAAYSK
ncbi:SMUG2 DNA glycosylase family protein [Chitinophaga pinensis]|uniref:Uracil-DNA glycosylase-like domain-containing protein n=1 Tax=Chitinophaga pinensis (strain ATCC 43595 / DSM 2588 / LMG 13176 / NBRC 15968 / NCIMB 11800 / UQM 2034) TaxID=485918 RepID=A0A979G9V4_CHIPD|nr:SMUG2 DNA glycosylase family protein [Chitinophaga pinensis]ACU63451.1 hypothetical protein Cpin_6039 [Chitinophaga pinensis DSM 2588]